MKNWIAAIVVSCAISPLAHSGTLTYTLRSGAGSWEAATGGVFTNVDFNSLSPQSCAACSGGLAVTTINGNVVFRSYYNAAVSPTAADVSVVSENNVSQPWYNWGGTGNVLRGDNYDSARGVNLLRISLPTSVNAFGADLMFSGPQPKAVRVMPGGVNVGAGTTFGDGYVALTSSSGAGAQKLFFGVSQDTSFNYVDIMIAAGASSEYLLVDNVAFGNATPNEAAEPGSLLMLLGGGSLLWLARRHGATIVTA